MLAFGFGFGFVGVGGAGLSLTGFGCGFAVATGGGACFGRRGSMSFGRSLPSLTSFVAIIFLGSGFE